MIKVFRKKKNPHLENIEEFIKSNSSEFIYLSTGGEGSVYYFKLNKRLILNTEILQPGEYALKIFTDKRTENNKGGLSSKKINKFLLLSKYGLIPKIFIITNKYIISKYIYGQTISDFQIEYPEHMDEVNHQIDKLIKVWNKLGFEHDDLSEDNILISDKGSIYFIDPYIKN